MFYEHSTKDCQHKTEFGNKLKLKQGDEKKEIIIKVRVLYDGKKKQ